MKLQPEITDKAMISYLREHVIEKVNFSMCSEVYNDLLLLP